MSYKIFQMDVKNAFLNKYIQNEMFVDQPHRTTKSTSLDHVFKALYGLKQAFMSWYDHQSKFLLETSFKEDKLIKPFLSRKPSMASYLFKFMLMTSS